MDDRPEQPGEVLKRDFLEPKGISQAQFADHTGWSRKHVNKLCRGLASVNANSALILAKATGTSPDYWMELQAELDIWDAMHSTESLNRLEKVTPLMDRVA